MLQFFKRKKNNKKDDGHVIYIDKLTDHHIQKDKLKDSKQNKKANSSTLENDK